MCFHLGTVLFHAFWAMALVKDVNIVCSTLKAFLRLVDEPLVTYFLRPKIIAAARVNCSPERAKHKVVTLLHRLPIQNQDKLAYILKH